jgi:hypothetical protein
MSSNTGNTYPPAAYPGNSNNKLYPPPNGSQPVPYGYPPPGAYPQPAPYGYPPQPVYSQPTERSMGCFKGLLYACGAFYCLKCVGSILGHCLCHD